MWFKISRNFVCLINHLIEVKLIFFPVFFLFRYFWSWNHIIFSSLAHLYCGNQATSPRYTRRMLCFTSCCIVVITLINLVNCFWWVMANSSEGILCNFSIFSIHCFFCNRVFFFAIYFATFLVPLAFCWSTFLWILSLDPKTSIGLNSTHSTLWSDKMSSLNLEYPDFVGFRPRQHHLSSID